MIKSDFDLVQPLLNDSLSLLAGLEILEMDKLCPEAQGYLLSHLKKHIGRIGNFVIKYEKKQK